MVVINVFTDGACSSNGQKKARGSWAAFFPEHEKFSEAGPLADSEPQTNQRGELRAILRAVDIIEKNFGFEVDVHILKQNEMLEEFSMSLHQIFQLDHQPFL